ncbi:MAG: TetR/AcrR family transcriptional regulator [Tenericutes bacterium]|jgi:AcrR family transcriptional regulator|nr:TetR/AcrR family transcriptional regulator [Mycoplasmatota bacterium]
MEKNQNIKEKIIKTAKSLLKEKGSFTIKEIADSCYINIAAVNYHFGSKENLLNLVLQEVVDELKLLLTSAIDSLPKNSANEISIERMLDLIYTYAIDNIGIINHLFLHQEYQSQNAQILIKEFFTDSPFTRDIYQKIAESTKTEDQETLRVKYMLLFSSFAIPLFIQILGMKTKNDILTLKETSFKKKYIHELLKILYE